MVLKYDQNNIYYILGETSACDVCQPRSGSFYGLASLRGYHPYSLDIAHLLRLFANLSLWSQVMGNTRQKAYIYNIMYIDLMNLKTVRA